MNFKQRLQGVGNLFKGAIEETVDMLDTVTYAKNDYIQKTIATATNKLKEDPRYFLRYKKLTDIATLPQPLDMEIGLVNSSRGDLQRPNVIIDRSYYQAKQVETLINGIHANQETQTPITVHILCGDAHRRQVTYFLKHPEYDIRKSIESAGKPILIKKE